MGAMLGQSHAHRRGERNAAGRSGRGGEPRCGRVSGETRSRTVVVHLVR